MPNFYPLVLILCAFLIVVGQYFATPPFSRWFFGAGVFVGVVWVLLVVFSLMGMPIR